MAAAATAAAARVDNVPSPKAAAKSRAGPSASLKQAKAV